VRDRGHEREMIQQRFRDAVSASEVPFVVIEGDWTARRERAIDAIDHLLADHG
jgi:nicotinamide riboside kinase